MSAKPTRALTRMFLGAMCSPALLSPRHVQPERLILASVEKRSERSCTLQLC
jgi:hypothetical protein